MLIAIPSMGRAGRVSTLDLVKARGKDVRLFVPEGEATRYRDVYNGNTDQVVGVPKRIQGITATRNWILEYASGKREREILMLDDDAIGFFKFEKGKRGVGVDAGARFLDHVDRMFVLARDAGTNLWGFQVTNDGKTYREFSPFSFISVVVGNCLGIIDDGQRFDERLRVKEDYDFALQSLLKYRRILRNNKFSFFVQHLKNPGGCASYRTIEVEREAVEILRKKWGPEIIGTHHRRGWEIVVRAPLRGI